MNDNYYGYVYLILDQKNNKIYIGQKKGKIENTLDYFGSGNIIQRIIKSRGTTFLKKIILGVCFSKDELLECETECKYFFDSFNPLYGYNLCIKDNAPMHGRKHSNESRKKMSVKLSNENSPSWGKPKSDETKTKIRNKLLNHEVSESTRQKLRDKNLGKKHTDETRMKISESHKGKKHTDEAKERMRIAAKTKKKSNKPAWNKGLTKETDERVKQYSIKMRKTKIKS